MKSTRAPVLVAIVVLSLCAIPLSAGGVAADSVALSDSGVADRATDTASASAIDGAVMPSTQAQEQERPDDPSTEETIGYVEGYWYDDDLPVDDRDDTVVEDDELDAVVSRSMARVEMLRELTFDGTASVELIDREAFQDDHDDMLGALGPDERIQQNVNYEALFMVDRETDALDTVETLYGGAVEGYYDPRTEQVVVVSDGTDGTELDEVVLGHELLHALQDQQFGLANYDAETIDGDAAENGLIEGDAVTVETAYEERCQADWDCLLPDGPAPDVPADINWGLYFTLFQPYDDGPDYVDHLREQGGWDAVDDAYDDPPTTTSETIRPGEDREPVSVDVADRSGNDWEPLEIDGEPATETVGEAGMASMFADGVLEEDRPSVIDREAFLDVSLTGEIEEIDYDQPPTDGWAGDELSVYVSDDATATTEPTAAAADAGYVWETEWISPDDAQQFAEGYVQLLDVHGSDPVADRQDTYEIDDDYPGAYYIDVDGETVTIVNAPSVDALDQVADGAAPSGADSLDDADGESETDGDEETTGDGEANATGDDEANATGDDDADTIAGFGLVAGVFSLALAVLAVRVGRQRG